MKFQTLDRVFYRLRSPFLRFCSGRLPRFSTLPLSFSITHPPIAVIGLSVEKTEPEERNKKHFSAISDFETDARDRTLYGAHDRTLTQKLPH